VKPSRGWRTVDQLVLSIGLGLTPTISPLSSSAQGREYTMTATPSAEKEIATVAGRPERRLGNVHAVADRLGCSWRTVYRHADTGKIPKGVKVGGMRRWDLSQIDAFIASGCKPLRN
jgi:excisionase family DNA binding protein